MSDSGVLLAGPGGALGRALDFLRNRGTGENLMTSVVVGVVLTAVSWLAARSLGFDFEFSRLEALAVMTSYTCTYLATVESRLNYPVGVVTTFLYSWLFFASGLYAVALFNLYLVFSLVYGWFRWGPDGPATRPVTDFAYKGRWPVIYLLIAAAVYLLLMAINRYFGVSMGWADVTVAVLSGVAQFMLDNKHRQTWAAWALVNVFSIWLYAKSGLQLVAVQYALFLLNTALGYALWTRSMREQRRG